MPNEKSRHCESCGQTIKKLNPHRMDRQKVRLLEDVAKLNSQGHEWLFLKEGEAIETADGKRIRTIYLARRQANTLCWFGLMDHQGPRTGGYRVNARGIRFLRGELLVPAKIWCRGGAVKEESEKEVAINEVKDVILDKSYWDNYWQQQKHSGDEFMWGGGQLEFI